MTVTLRRRPLTAEQKAIFIQAVMTGVKPSDLDVDEAEEVAAELDGLALNVGDSLPNLLTKARLSDTYDHRVAVIGFVLDRWARPKSAAPSRSYRKFARR